MNCDISTARVAQLTQSKELYWCPDYFGILHNNLLAEDDYHKSIPLTSIVHASYTENEKTYWLTYYSSTDTTLDFLQAIEQEAFMSLSGNHGYTIYDRHELSGLADTIPNAISAANEACELSPAAMYTFDQYLTVWREIFLLYAEKASDATPWSVAKYVHKTKGVSNKLMDWYIRQHRCPVCGCYYTSTETTCIHCSFPELNVQFVNKEEYLLWEKEKLIPYREFYKLQNP